MKRDQVNDYLTQYLQEDIPADSIQLWPRLKRSLIAKTKLSTQHSDLKVNNHKRTQLPLSRAASVIVVAILAGVFLFVTPQGRAFAQDFLKFFTRLDQDEKTAPQVHASLEPQSGDQVAVELEETPVLEQGCGSIISPICDLATVQSGAPFKVYGLSILPKEMQLVGAVNLSNGVAIKYTGENGVLLLIQTLVDETLDSTWVIGRSATIQSTHVHHHLAEFVQGSWSQSGLDEEPGGQLAWDESQSIRTLRWQIEGVEYSLINFPAQGVSGPLGYDQLEMELMAESVGVTTAQASIVWQQEGINLAEAERQAGFSFLPAANIPAGQGLYKTTYDSQHNSICQYYRSKNDEPDAPTLVIGQSTWAMPGINELMSEAYFGEQPVTFAVSQEALPLNGAYGNQGTFIETGLQVEAFCGGTPAIANRALLWQKDGRSFVLFGKLDSFAGTGFVTKLELQRIAASLNGEAEPVEVNTIDPERLHSRIEAESVANFQISQPAVMLNTMQFDHISVGRMMGLPFMVVTQYLGDELTLNGVERVLVFQTNQSNTSLAELKLAGEFMDVLVKGQAAIYNEHCGQDPAYGTLCNQILSWFEGDTQYDVITYTTAMVPFETMLTIANSMR